MSLALCESHNERYIFVTLMNDIMLCMHCMLWLFATLKRANEIQTVVKETEKKCLENVCRNVSMCVWVPVCIYFSMYEPNSNLRIHIFFPLLPDSLFHHTMCMPQLAITIVVIAVNASRICVLFLFLLLNQKQYRNVSLISL